MLSLNSNEVPQWIFVIIFLLDGAQEKLETFDTFTPCMLETMSEELREPLPKEVHVPKKVSFVKLQ